MILEAVNRILELRDYVLDIKLIYIDLFIAPIESDIECRGELVASNLAEKVYDTSKDHKQDSSSRTQSQHFWQETLVQSAKAFLLHYKAEG